MPDRAEISRVRPGTDVVLRNQRVVTLRPLEADDSSRVAELWRRLDANDRRRFLDLAHLPVDTPEAVASPRPGRIAGVTAIVRDGTRTRVVGIARYERSSGESTGIDDAAQFMVFVDPSWRRTGLGTVLVRQLAESARHAGIGCLLSDVPAGDTALSRLLGDLGLDYQEQAAGTWVHARVMVHETDAYLEAVLADQRAAARRALEPFLRPQSIALVGASDDPTSIGNLLMVNVRASGYAGALYPVNPNHTSVGALEAYPDLRSCPTSPDLAVVAVPAPAVAGVLDDAAASGIRAVCVISAGYAESGPAGKALQDELVQRARTGGIRLIGPNCMGLANGGPEPRFNATFSPTFPPAGRLAFISQSGGLGLAALALLTGPGVGMSGFVSVGNTADLGPNDLLLYFDDDPTTDFVLAYLESVPEPRRFARITRGVSRRTPIVVIKSGRTSAGKRAASSHTAAMAAGERAVDALFRQAGIIRADTLQAMFDIGTVLSTKAVPGGRRVAVVTNGGGPGILVADACEAAGLLVPVLSETTQATLRSGLPAEAAVGNPVDMVATASAGDYARALRTLGNTGEIDAVIAVFIPPFLTKAEDVAAEIARVSRELPPPISVAAVFMTDETPPTILAQSGVPTFRYPEQAAIALGRIAQWVEWRNRPVGRVIVPSDIDQVQGRSAVDAFLATSPGGGWLGPRDAEQLLAAYRIPIVRTRHVTTPEEAATAQAEIGGTVVVKVAAAIHKSDVGGVLVGLDTPNGASDAVTAIRESLARAGMAEHGHEFLVQEQVLDGVEMIVGVNHDPAFGPLVLIGLGGSNVELLGDVALRLTPLSDVDIDEMLRSLRSYPLLTGYRNSPPMDVAALAELLHRVSALVEDIPEIAELDLNPVFVRRHGVVVADIRIRLQPG
ncbi:MAG: GNAT family N-acetyltransferase [Actinomycetota bacterium]|nr:GNAT family N-acetyltransferase [Actinomycetota bacterium]